ncbi:MAG: hypothetical protein JTT11_08980 [Candidatus Brockarchaeota archaeon]|nr:hypothetical protein [Candidatus Brockarchaeota archaeon]
MLDADTIRAAIGRLSWSDMGTSEQQLTRLFEFATWAITLPQQQYIELFECESGAPQWNEGLFPPGTLDKARERFEKQERLAFHVPVTVVLKSEAGSNVKHKTFFHVYLEKDNLLTKGEENYIRQGITIRAIRMLGDKPVRGLVVVSDKALSTLLGDAESPAHMNWEERSRKVAERYHNGASTVRFVKNALRELVALLSKPATGLDEDLLRDLFYINLPDEDGQERANEKKPKGVMSTRHAPNLPGSKESPIQINRLADGFHISLNPRATKRPSTIRVKVAYDVRRGNPFKWYDPLDFELNKPPVKIDVKEAKITSISKNELEVAINANNFELAVRGFDPKRDVKVWAGTGGDES